MAREPLGEEVDKTFRCLDEVFLFPGKMEYVRHRVEVPGGYQYTELKPNRPWGIHCPNDPFHRIELVKE